MLIAALSAVILLAQAAPAQAQPEPTSPTKAEKPKKPKMICRDEGETGSFLTKRVCRTPEQIEAEREASRKAADDVRNRAELCRARSC